MKPASGKPWRLTAGLLSVLAVSGVWCVQSSSAQGASEERTIDAQTFEYEAATVENLVSGSKTVIGQPFAYPEGDASITGSIITMQPGTSTGWHRHNAPLFGYILEGEITVDYGSAGLRKYHVGEAFVEAFGTDHNGMNSGEGVVRILAVFAGADSVQNTEASSD